jgi:hypothetical protein
MRELDGLVGRRALGRLEEVGRTSQKQIGVKGGEKEEKNRKEAREKKAVI